MKILPYKNNFSYNFQNNKQQSFTAKTVSFCGLNDIQNPSYLKPLTKAEKEKLSEIREIERLSTVNGVFSLDKAAALLKSKIDKQQMLYSEDDIKTVVKKVSKANPAADKQEILNVLMKLSSFSNYESLSKIEQYCKKNNISEVFTTKELNINNIFSYFSKSQKGLIKLAQKDNNNSKRVIFLDRETIKELKKLKKIDEDYINNLKEYITDGRIKPVIIDGFEAKIKEGLKSFNIAGKWGDLAAAASSVIKESKEGKNPFIDDIMSDAKEIFGENIKIDILNNDCEDINEKIIADRLNPKTMSKDYIKKIFNGISKYSAYILITTYCHKIPAKELDKTIQPALIKSFYPVVEVYSPRRIAAELKNLHGKINKNLDKSGRNFNDVVFLTPNKEKSFGLITYQYSKVNDTDNLVVYPNYKDMTVDRNKTRGKVFLCLDDFSGSGQSFLQKDLPYLKFKKCCPANSIIFAPVAYTNEAIKKINSFIENSQKSKYPDYFIGNTKIKDISSYLNLLPSPQDYAIKFAKKSGYSAGMNVIAFSHVIPDNCPDIVGMLLKGLLTNEAANKAEMDFMKECRIEALSKVK